MKHNLLLSISISTASLLILSACGGGRPVSNNPYAVNAPVSVNSLPSDQYGPRITGHSSTLKTKKVLPKYESKGIHEDIWNDQDQKTAKNNQSQTPAHSTPAPAKTPTVTPKPTPTPTPSKAQQKYNQGEPLIGNDHTLYKVKYSLIPGWTTDNMRKAIPGLLLSCRKIVGNPNKDALLNYNTGVGGSPRDWTNVCNALENIKTASNTRLRQFMEKAFTPYKVDEEGLYTAYVGYSLQASLVKNKVYKYPVYSRPHDLIFVNVGTFDQRYRGKYFSGRIKYPYLIPYYSRGEIYKGALENKNLAIVYVKDYIDLLMLQIQGSGLAILPDGTSIRLAYGGNNGYPSKSIGKYMMSRGLISPPGSLQQIRNYFKKYPQQVEGITAYNKRYVFFRKSRTAAGVSGAQGVPLTPERSIAVDRKYYPLGLPMFISTTRPIDKKPFNQMVVAQDTGSAIQGPARADIYWGETKKALRYAGHMKNSGSLFVFLPKRSEEKCRICSK